MRKSYKAILFASTLALGLGLGSCSKSDGNEPNPSPVNPTTSPQLISASEAQVNNKSISILRSAAEQKLKVKQISTLAGGTGGYNVLLSDERLVQIYIAGTARSLRQSTNSNTEQNPVAAVDFTQKGKAIFTLLDKSKIELDRTDANESRVLATAQSVAPESKFLFTFLGGISREFSFLHSKAKSITVNDNDFEWHSISFNSDGYPTHFEYRPFTSTGAVDQNIGDVTDLVWSGERLISGKLVTTNKDDSGPKVDISAYELAYNELGQAFAKPTTGSIREERSEIIYNPAQRQFSIVGEEKMTHSYDEFFRLIKREDYDKSSGSWQIRSSYTYSYNERGDVSTIKYEGENSNSTTNYIYEYDTKGNWIKRSETRVQDALTSSSIVTRSITY